MKNLKSIFIVILFNVFVFSNIPALSSLPAVIVFAEESSSSVVNASVGTLHN